MIDGVPTMLDLVEMSKGMAEPYARVTQYTQDGRPSLFHLTPKGSAYLGEIQRQRAREKGPLRGEALRELFEKSRTPEPVEPKPKAKAPARSTRRRRR